MGKCSPPFLLLKFYARADLADWRAFLYGLLMATPCRKYACPNLVTTRQQHGYCNAHANLRTGWAVTQAVKGNTTQRGYGHAWRKLRAHIMERDRYLCQPCRQAGRLTPANAVDHIINKASGGSDEMTNLQAICNACHKAKTQTESGRGG